MSQLLKLMNYLFVDNQIDYFFETDTQRVNESTLEINELFICL